MEYSERLVETLETIDNPVSEFLLSLNGSNIDTDIDNIDLSRDSNCVSYNRNGKETKVKLKVGRFVSKFSKEFTARDIEVFVNKFKSLSEINKVKGNFELVSGKAGFREGYSTSNYAEMSGSLGSSCMNDSIDRLSLYMKNPKKIKLLLLRDDSGKVLGRAIVWRRAMLRVGEKAEDRNNAETLKGCIVMDRPYTTKEFYYDIFMNYAKEQGWYVRSHGLHMVDPDGNEIKARMKVKLKNYKVRNFPYLDTMRSISKKGTISNRTWKAENRFF